MRWLSSRQNWLWSVLIVSLAFNAGFGTTFGVRSYRHHCRDSPHGEDASLASFHDELNLTPEQEGPMRAAKEKLFKQIDELDRAMTAERETLGRLLTASVTDEAAIASQLDKIASLQRQVQQRVVDHLLQEKEMLAPGQHKAFNEIIRRRVCPCGEHGPESVSGSRGGHDASGPRRGGTHSGKDPR